MKDNKGKEVAGEGNHSEAGDACPNIVPQTRPSAGDKRKSLPRNLDLGSLPSHRDKRVRHSSSKVTKPILPQPNLTVQAIDVDVSPPIETTSSKTPPRTITSVSSQPPPRVSSNIIENEDLAWQHFEEVVKDEDIHACYDMSLKDFEHSGVHDLFKVNLLSSCLHYFVTFLPSNQAFFSHRPCLNSSQSLGRPLSWTRRGSYWRRP